MSKKRDRPSQDRQVGHHVESRSGGIDIQDSHIHVDGDMVGGDKTTEIHLPPLTWVVPIVILMLALFVFAVLWLPQLVGSGPMTHTFNIAVADFTKTDEHGKRVSWEDGTRLSETIYTRIDGEFKANPALNSIVEVRYKGIGAVQGSTREERDTAAGVIAKSVGAHLVIYGNLASGAGETTFIPEFYVGEIKGAEEIKGANQLGQPITGTWTSLGGALVLGKALQSRTEALTLFTMGLAFLAAGDRGSAITAFEQATAVKGWKDSEGKEVVYLSLGTALAGSKEPADWIRAREAYAMSLQLNPRYARPYIGLGNLYYAEFARSGSQDITLLDQAMGQYEKARDAEDKPTTAYVMAKVHVSLGNIYTIKGQLLGSEWFTKAESEYSAVVTEFENGNKQLEPFAGISYLSLGVIQERSGNLSRAAGYYQKAVDSLAGSKDLRQQAQIQLDNVKRLQSTPGPQ